MNFNDAAKRHLASIVHMSRYSQVVDDRARLYAAAAEVEFAFSSGLALWRNWNAFKHIEELPALFGLPLECPYWNDEQVLELQGHNYEKCATTRAAAMQLQPVVCLQSAVDYADELTRRILDLIARSDVVTQSLQDLAGQPDISPVMAIDDAVTTFTLESYLKDMRILKSHLAFCAKHSEQLTTIMKDPDPLVARIAGVAFWRVRTAIIDLCDVCNALGITMEVLDLPQGDFVKSVEVNFSRRDATAETLADTYAMHPVVFRIANMHFAREMIGRIHDLVGRTFVDLWAISQLTEQRTSQGDPTISVVQL